MLQSCSGHSNKTGETADGFAVFSFFGICTFKPVTGLICEFAELTLTLLPLSFPLNGGGLSSFDFRFSARGARNSIGDVDGVLLHVLLPELLDDEVVAFPDAVVVDVLVVDVLVLVDDLPPARPLAFAFRNLL